MTRILLLLLFCWLSMASPAQFIYTGSTVSGELQQSHNWWKNINPNLIGCNGAYNPADADIVSYGNKTEMCLVGWINRNYPWASFNDSLINLQPLVNLQRINLPSTVNDIGIEHISKLRGLKVLESTSGGMSNLTNLSMKYISGLQNLEAIRFSGCINVNDEGLRYLSNLSNLKELWLIQWNITDKSMASVSSLKNLRILKMKRTGITYKGISLLPQLPYLEDLDLELTAVTNEAIKYLGEIKNLKVLNLSNTSVNDKAADLLIQLIRSKKGFQALNIYGQQMSSKAKKQIADACPGVAVRY